MTILNTSSKVRRERITISSAALFDAALIALLLTMVTSKFILASGYSIEVEKHSLPSAQSPDVALADAAIDVLNAKGNSMIIFDGNIFNVKTFAREMESTNNKKFRQTLLIKADKNVDAQTLLDICSAARKGGFKSVHLATEKAE